MRAARSVSRRRRTFEYDERRVRPGRVFLPEHFTGEGRVYARRCGGSTPKSGDAYGDAIE